MRFGIIGCSRVARRRFLPALVASREATLVHIGSRDAEKACIYAREFGAERYGSYEAVLEDPEVDVVYISTPPTLHTEWVLKVARAGKHIICEKPAFPDVETARRAVEICRARGVRLMENYAFLYHPQHAAAHALTSRIGGVEHIRVVFSYPLPPRGDIRFNPELGGGVFHDSFGYPIAIGLFYFKEQPVHASYTQTFNPTLGIDTRADILLSFSNGRTLEGSVQIGSSDYVSLYRLEGPHGAIEVRRAFAVDADMPVEVVLFVEGKEEKKIISPANQFQCALKEFVAVVRGERASDFEHELLARAEVREMALERVMKR